MPEAAARDARTAGAPAAHADARGSWAPAPAAGGRPSGPASLSIGICTDGTAWDAYVSAHPEAFGSHEWAWRDVFERVFGHACHYLAARTETGAIAGVLPIVEIRSFLFGRSMTSLPFLNFGGVLASSPLAARQLLESAGDLARSRGCPHVEFRHISRIFTDLPCRQHKVTMRLGLRSAGASAPASGNLWDRIDRKARNQVRKAQKSNLTVDRGGSELVPDFYQVFARNMRDLGTPVYPAGLFDAVIRQFPGRARIIVVRLEGKPVAAGLTIRTRDMVEIPWASSIRDYNHLCPNHLLYWHALETAAAEGAAVFDFGRSTPGEGTFRFKEQWGAAPVPLHWEYWLASGAKVPDHSPKNPKLRLAIGAWKKLPVPVANLIGPRVVRGIP
jgi:FemAB-related protein (PEP-CTERM system-associated)